MKNAVLFLTLIMFVFTSVAQDKAKQPQAKTQKGKLTVEQRAQRSVDQLDKAVTLSADQKTKIYALALERENKIEAMKGKYKGKTSEEDKAAAKAEYKKAHKEYRLAVKDILTAEQKEKLKEQVKQKAKEKNKGKNQGGNTTKEPTEELEELIPVE